MLGVPTLMTCIVVISNLTLYPNESLLIIKEIVNLCSIFQAKYLENKNNFSGALEFINQVSVKE